jgi:hypothetical protein
MEKVIKENLTKSSSENNKIEMTHDFLLIKQGSESSEMVYFNKDEITELTSKIENGEIVIDISTSLLTKTRELMLEAPHLGCFITVFKG